MEIITKNPRRILIVDDDVLNSAALGKRLERRGFSATIVSDGTAILDLIEYEKIELVLLDIIMPTVDGLTLLTEIRAKYSKNEIPVIMVTAVDDSFDIVDAFKFGASDYIMKPVNIDVALARINAQLSFVDFYKLALVKNEMQTINAMVATYNHEINNPLVIAFGALKATRINSKDFDILSLDKVDAALQRIAEIVRKIEEVGENKKVSLDTYTGSVKMVKVT